MQIRECFGVNREEAHRCAVFRRHVGDGRAIGNAEARKAAAVKFDEFSDDAFLAQHFRHRQNEVGCRCAVA